MNFKLNNKGMTLVEIIISLVILGIIGVSFTECFVSSTRILNRATLYKNESAKATEAVEVQDSNDIDVSTGTIKFKVSNGKSVTASGDYVSNKIAGNSDQTGLIYKEFVSGNAGGGFDGRLAEDLDNIE